MQYILLQHRPADFEPVFVVLLIAFISFMVLTISLIKVLIWCKIFSKAGYSWALGLLTLLPIVDIIMYFFLAFSNWPVRRELQQLKQQQNKPVI
jgi:uncharacterized membrane protein